MNELTITELTSKYYLKAAKVYLESYNEEPTKENLKRVAYYIKLRGTHLIALMDNKVVGMLVAPDSNLNPSLIEFSYLAVSERYRHKGIATELINELIKRSSNKKGILTYTKMLNKEALKLYEKNGFNIFDSDGTSYILFKRL